MEKWNPEPGSVIVLMPNLNKGDHVVQAITSLKRQSSDKWAMICVDHGSTDGSGTYLEAFADEYPGRVINITNLQGVISSTDYGVGIGAVRGYLMASVCLLLAHPRCEKLLTGDPIIAWLDSDDTLPPEAIEDLLKFYVEHPQARFVGAQMLLCDENMNTIQGQNSPCILTPKKLPDTTLLEANQAPGWRTFRLSAYMDLHNKGLGYDPYFLTAEDRDMDYKLEEITPYHLLKKHCYNYRMLPRSASRGRNEYYCNGYNIVARHRAFIRRGQSPAISRMRFTQEEF